MHATTPPLAAKNSSFAAARNNGSKPRPNHARVPTEDSAEGRSRLILAAMVAFRDGDFAVRLPSDWVGTEARTAEAFNQTIAQKHRICAEVTRLGASVEKEGRLRQRMSLPGAIGEWAAEVDSINTLIDDLVRPTTEIARTIGAVAKGDLGQSMELEVGGRTLKGEFPRSAKLVNTMIEQLSVFTSEVTRVAREVGTEGALGGQAEVEGVAGTWKDLTDNVNSMASNLTGQVRNIAEVTIAVANGDLSKKITADVRGEILQLKETINTMISNLRETTESNREQDWLKTNLAKFSSMLQGQRPEAAPVNPQEPAVQRRQVHRPRPRGSARWPGHPGLEPRTPGAQQGPAGHRLRRRGHCAILARSQALVDRLTGCDGSPKQDAIKLREMLGTAAQEVERISRNLRPTVLEHLGLPAVLRATGTEFAERTGVFVKVNCVKSTARLPLSTEMALFRILQQALTNVEQHAHARQVTLNLTQPGDSIQLTIQDDGVGFDPDLLRAKQYGKGGLGLLGMHERATSIGGDFKIKSVLQTGTEIEVRIPLCKVAGSSGLAK